MQRHGFDEYGQPLAAVAAPAAREKPTEVDDSAGAWMQLALLAFLAYLAYKLSQSVARDLRKAGEFIGKHLRKG